MRDIPPSEAEHFEIDRENLPSQVKEGLLGHQWVQRGPYLVCVSGCPIEHSVYIGTKVIFVGYDENGYPKLVPYKEK